MALLRTLTLGCKVNQYETELVREGFSRAGFVDAQQDEEADICVVNTCTVTNDGDYKSRKEIRKLARDNPNTRIVVMGCYATRAPEELAKLPNVVEVLTDKREIPDLLGRFGVIDIPNGISRFGTKHRAFVKVQDGCLLRCSYCIIPHVRPNVLSRSIDHIEEEVLRLVDNNYREVVLTGVHLGHFGVESNWNKPKQEWTRLSHLVRRLAQLPVHYRLRLSSIEATEVTRELIAVMAEFPETIAPHLHICLQSGSDSVLRRMRRRWGTRLFLDRCELVRKSLDEPAISTDVIVGFPGETDEEFESTLQTCRTAGFSKIHIFPFSARKGTPAAEMSGMISPELKAERVERLTELERELRHAYFAKMIGRRLRVLVEGELPVGQASCLPGRVMVGTSCRYVPVHIVNGLGEPNDLVDAMVTGATADHLIATS